MWSQNKRNQLAVKGRKIISTDDVKGEMKATHCFGDEVEQMDAQADFLLVVTWSKGEGHLVVSGVHHVFVPLCKTAGDGLQHNMDLKKQGESKLNYQLLIIFSAMM